MKDLSSFINTSANWLEIIGFLLAIFTAIKVFFINKEVKRISAKHLFAVRVNEHLVEYKKTSKQIALLLSAYTQNIKEIRLEISRCLGNSLSLKKKVEKNDLISLEKLITISNKIKSKKIDISSKKKWYSGFTKQRSILSENDIDEFYESLTFLINEIEQLIKDNKKSIK